ncbi:hypothetical protein ACFLQ0_04815 [Nitrospinota bacterium]
MIRKLVPFIPIFVLIALAAGCGANTGLGGSFRAPSGVSARTSEKIGARRLKRIGVLPFRNESGVAEAGIKIAKFFYEGLAPSPQYEVQPPPPTSEEEELQFEFRLTGGRNEGVRSRARDTGWLKSRVNRFISTVQPYLTNLEMVYPGEYFEGKVARPKMAAQGTVAKSSPGAAEDQPLDAVLTGVVTRFRNRAAGPWVGDHGPHVSYNVYLVSTEDGEILWEATFNEEQIFLLDNLLLLPRYAEHGFAWQRNDQFARSGLKRVLATFPGLSGKIAQKRP